MRARDVTAAMCVFSVMATSGFAQGESAPARRVRSERPQIAALIEEGIARSRTFAELVSAIDRTDGLVYVDEGKCPHGVRACLAISVTVAGPYRLLRIRIDSHRPRRAVVASLGHELRHAVEVLREPGIRNNFALFHFLQLTTPTAQATFETRAAIQAGMDVCAELGRDD
jgi:hypothetical protein